MSGVVRVGSALAATVVALVACSSSSGTTARPVPGDACDGSAPLACGTLAKGSDQAQVVLFCKDGKYTQVLDCAPGGNGETNRCFEEASSTIVDCFDYPANGHSTRCQVQGSGTSTTSRCARGSIGG